MSEKDVSNEEAACADTVVQAFALSPLQRMVVPKESVDDGIRASLLILDTTTCNAVAPTTCVATGICPWPHQGYRKQRDDGVATVS